MALKYCPNCKRKLSAEPTDRNTIDAERHEAHALADEIDAKARITDPTCPSCGAPLAGSDTGGGSARGRRYALALVFALVVVNIYSVMTRETGPPPELEALHSAEDAIRQCREGIESRLSDRRGTVEGLLEAEYLQGGEYDVRGAVSVVEGISRVTRPVLCEAQFRPEGGWTIGHVEVGF